MLDIGYVTFISFVSYLFWINFIDNLITTTFCALFCYMIYYNLKNSENENNYIMILLDVTALIVLIFSLILSGVIAMIDIEAKKGLHLIYGCTLKLSNKEKIFKVTQLTYLLYFLLVFYVFIFFFDFQIRLYLNRVLMSTIGLEVLEKPINFENILNVRNQLIFKNCNKFIDLFSDNCPNDDLSLNYNQI